MSASESLGVWETYTGQKKRTSSLWQHRLPVSYVEGHCQRSRPHVLRTSKTPYESTWSQAGVALLYSALRRLMPKRALEETGAIPDGSDGTSLPSSCEELTPSSSQGDDCREDGSPPRKCKRKSVGFNDVTVYYFQRMQGFTCVPSQGGSTLGMSPVHTEKKTFSLKQHSAERRRLHFPGMDPGSSSSSPTDETLTSFEDCGGRAPSDFDEEEDRGEGGEEDADTLNCLQPVPTRQRRALLRASGVRKIDALEKDECRDIRASREFCGCACRGRCLPQECSCSQAGIPCQVDRMSFPCGCTREGCSNESGRTEFNPLRVRAHFLHTLMRLELEKQQHRGDGCDPSSTTQLSLNFHRLNPRALVYYGGGSVETTAARYSSEEEEEEEEEEETSYSENSDYSTEDETEETREESYDGTSDERQGDDASGLNGDATSLDYTDLSEAVPKDCAATEERREATRGVVPVDPVFVGCGDDCATTGPEQTVEIARLEDGEGSSSTATTDSAFGEIIKASLGEVSTL